MVAGSNPAVPTIFLKDLIVCRYYLIIYPSGSKYWRYDYSYATKRKTLALGVFPVFKSKWKNWVISV